MPKTKSEKRESSRLELPLRLLKGGVTAVVFAAAVLAAVAALVSLGVLNRAVAENSVSAACVLGALVGGLCALKHCERGFLPVGLGAGATGWLILLIVGAVCFGGIGRAGEMVGPAFGCLAGGGLAGVLRALRHGGGRRNG